MKQLLVTLNGAGERGVRDQLLAFALKSSPTIDAAAELLGITRGSVYARRDELPADVESAREVDSQMPAAFRVESVAEMELWLLNKRTEDKAKITAMENRIMRATLMAAGQPLPEVTTPTDPQGRAVFTSAALLRGLLVLLLVLLLPVGVLGAIKSPRAASTQTSTPMFVSTVGQSSAAAPTVSLLSLPTPKVTVIVGSTPAIGRSGITTLAWDASPSVVAGYRLYWGVSHGNYTNSADVGNVLKATVQGLVEGQTYYYAATAYDTDGVESVFSNEATNTIPFRIYGPTPSAYDVGSYGKNGATNTFQYSTNGGATWRSFGTAFKGDGKTYRTVTFTVTNAPGGTAIFRMQAQ